MIDKIIFSPDYFKEIDKVEHIRKPLESPGTFEEIIKIYYKKRWFGVLSKTESYSFTNKEDALNLLEKLQYIMNGSSILDELRASNEEVK
jgi:hypothetical protein